MLRALVAGAGIALIAGPLGCFVVWRRMAYFGATLAHAALLGIAFGLMFNVSLYIGMLAVSVVVSLLLMTLQHYTRVATDTLLGILAHATLAIGLVLVSFLDNVRFDLTGYLFGDILAVSGEDLVWILGGGALCLIILARIWRALLAVTIHEDLARVDGERVELIHITFLLLLSVVVALAMQVVGLLLIVSMLIIPAAAARRFSLTPEHMAIAAVFIGLVAVSGGLASSLQWDTPAGPSIVTVAALLFAGSFLFPAIKSRRT